MDKPGESSAKSEYNWNIRSKYYIITNEDDPDNDDSTEYSSFIKHAASKPTKKNEIAKFIADHKLNHGDLVNFGEYRQTEVIIVTRADDGEMSWIPNPDDHGAGYMTIPASVLKNVTDCVEKYREVMNHLSENNQSFNMHVSPKDLLIKDKLGDVPEGWEFDIHFIAPEDIEAVYIKHPEVSETKEFNWYEISWEGVTDYFTAKIEGGEESKFNVRAMLKGDDMQQFITKHTKPGGSRYSWRAARPKLPKGWQLEVGQSMGGSDSVGWVWKLCGPGSAEDKAVEKVQEFFGDSPFEKVAADEVNLKFQ